MDANTALSRSSTLRKKGSIRRADSLKRSASRKSLRSLKHATDSAADSEFNNVFHTPIPTSGSPTDVLANRFQVWRKLLKDLINYFREIQASYEARSKALIKISNVLNNTTPSLTISSNGGLEDAARVLRNFHKHSLAEANKAKDIEEDVITQLNGLRSDLNQKIKEIKSLSGDFKNSVEKEKENTRRVVGALQDALSTADHDPSSISGKGDPFVVRLAVDRQVEKQIDEENYLHRAYLNLEGSGRELESIVVGEIQKAYNAYAGILKREADQATDTIDALRSGPIAMRKDFEWSRFTESDPHFVNPKIAPRRIQDIQYPGKYAPLAAEIRAGMLERKSKYLKSYTAGWYVLSPTHLHEFKSADHLHHQTPVMSLCLLEQRLGSKSAPGGSSHKFSLKGRQSGSMHRGHSWVFRAESYDTMLAWYDDITVLTEKSGEEKTAFVRRHARSVSGGTNQAPSVSSDGLEEDEADQIEFSANNSSTALEAASIDEAPAKRPEPGGRFPSEMVISRRLRAPISSSSGSSLHSRDAVAMANALPSAIAASSLAPHSNDKQVAELQSPAEHHEAEEIVPRVDSAAHGRSSGHGKSGASEHPSGSTLSPTAASHSQGDTQIHVDGPNEVALPADVSGGVVAGLIGGAALQAHKDSHEDEHPEDSGRSSLDHEPVSAVVVDGERATSSFDTTTGSTAATSVDASQAGSSHTGALLGVKDSSYLGSRNDISEMSDDTTMDGQQSMPPPSKPAAPHALDRQPTEISVSDLHVPGEFPSPTPVVEDP